MQLPKYSAKDFGKVAVLMGGESAEREISLESGKAVHAALTQSGIDAHVIDYKPGLCNQLVDNAYDRVFLALHGRGGEDGTVQKELELVGIPYTGSSSSASALAMDKVKSKSIWHKAGLSTPDSIEVNENSNWKSVAKKIGLPVMIKPVREGSSFGAAKIDRIEDLFQAWINASQFDDRVMAESWITGQEYTVPILDDKVLPIIKLETKNKFYDYDAKYNDSDTKYICPCGLDESFESDLGDVSKEACRLLGVSGWARVDLLVDSNNQEWLIEVNTIPGMTSHSLVPMSAKKAGITFENLVKEILLTSFKQ
tara:strand:+ start:23043 stop:23975 length:933 start_codon:yes stop_codon:yes gene_type:complete